MTARRRNIYAALLLLGLVAVAVDRAMGPGVSRAPQTALAVDTAPLSAGPAVSDAVHVEAAPFPRGLPPVATGEPARDPFAPPPQLLNVSDEQTSDNRMPGAIDLTAGPKTPSPPEPPPSVTFGQSHRLSAVLADGHQGIILLDDQLLEIGQAVDECTLTRVEDTAATFSCSHGPVTLYVETRSGTAP